jgi:hypothetical protein
MAGLLTHSANHRRQLRNLLVNDRPLLAPAGTMRSRLGWWSRPGWRRPAWAVSQPPTSLLGRPDIVLLGESEMIVERTYELTVGDQTTTAGPGTIVLIPRNVNVN